MYRLAVVLAVACAAGCVAQDPAVDAADQALGAPAPVTFTREHVVADIYHYTALVRVGTEPNAVLRIHRVVREVAPFVPRRTAHAAMLLHGDFSTFVTNFAPTLGDPASPASGLAPYLAAHDIDVWGLDRRWTIPGTDGDVSDFATMGVAQELDDLRHALAIARGVRTAGGSGSGQLALIGFSHGAELAYAYAAVEGARPAALRHVDALVAFDFYGDVGDDAGDVRAQFCATSAGEYSDVAQGTTDYPNDFLISVGQLARTAPDDPSPFFDGMSNRAAMLLTVGQTYLFAAYSPVYHLLAPVLTDGVATGLRETREPAATAWLAGATPHQAALESADLDALLCGTGPMPVDAPLSRVSIPLYYIGAAGGVGALGLHSTTQVSSKDVSTLIVQRFGADRAAEDFGHADLAYAADAPALVWRPLTSWLVHH